MRVLRSRYILDSWEKRHGIWKLYKHDLPDVKATKPLLSGSSSAQNKASHNVVIKFMHDTLELKITLGHQITPDTIPNSQIEETISSQEGDSVPSIIRSKTIRKVLHWTLLKIEFSNPSKLMQSNRKSQTDMINDSEDVKLAHYLLLRSLTPSRLAEQCPNTKHLHKTLNMIAKASSFYLMCKL